MTGSELLSGFVGALIVFVMQVFIEWRKTNNRLRSHKDALASEIFECGRLSAELGPEGVLAPLYRLPTTIYQHSLPALLADGGLSGEGVDALLRFYAEVETLNRGLDLADMARREGYHSRATQEHERNLLKAQSISAPDGQLFESARQATIHSRHCNIS